MNNNRAYNTILKGLQNDVYKTVRLVRIDNDTREVLIPYTKIGEPQNAIDRFEHIKYKLEKTLPSGTYVIECKTGASKTSLQDSFKIVIKAPAMMPVKPENKNSDDVQDFTNDSENMANIDLEDYIEVIKEKERLNAQVSILLTEIAMMKAAQQQAPAPLNDAPTGIGGVIMKSLDSNGPVILSLLDKYLSQRDKSNELKERELDLKSKSGTKIKKAGSGSLVDRNKILQDMNKLYDSDRDSFDATMDEMEQRDPKLYDFICEKMGLENDEEEEETPDSEDE